MTLIFGKIDRLQLSNLSSTHLSLANRKWIVEDGNSVSRLGCLSQENRRRRSKIYSLSDGVFSRTFHTYPICLPNFDFDKEGGDGGEVKMLYPKRNWENYQILYSLKVSWQPDAIAQQCAMQDA